MLEQITPLILTYNEAPNLARTLEPLRWAREIVIVDSFSDDETLAIAANFPQVRVVQRAFDSFANQANFALRETGMNTDWVLALDADYEATPELIDEITRLEPVADGYRARFVYCINGQRLRGTAYPPVTVLYRRERAVYRQDGHAHRVEIDGQVEMLKSFMLHDDRKPLSRWFRSQDIYARQEAAKLAEATELGFNDRLRRLRWLAPFLVFFYCLFVQRNILDGRAGLFYAFQRMLAETMLSLRLLEQDLGAATERDS
jgi:glycosyltransferase involved in cell wall biosynthesis